MSADHEKHLKRAKVLRVFRKLHRLTGTFLFAFFFVVAFTGRLMGWNNGLFKLA